MVVIRMVASNTIVICMLLIGSALGRSSDILDQLLSLKAQARGLLQRVISTHARQPRCGHVCSRWWKCTRVVCSCVHVWPTGSKVQACARAVYEGVKVQCTDGVDKDADVALYARVLRRLLSGLMSGLRCIAAIQRRGNG